MGAVGATNFESDRAYTILMDNGNVVETATTTLLYLLDAMSQFAQKILKKAYNFDGKLGRIYKRVTLVSFCCYIILFYPVSLHCIC